MKKSEREVIFPVVVGGMIEFYEIYLFIYWAPFLAKHFLNFQLTFSTTVLAIVMVVLWLISRPIGGLIFGFIGDHWGRKAAFYWSIVCVCFSSFGMVIMPISASWGIFYIIYIGIMKIIQGIPSGGEVPGSMCLLAESAEPTRKRYLCSYALVGPQLGQIFSMTQCLILETYFSPDFLIHYGWRISFLLGGLIGLLGIFLRKKIHESPSFKHLQETSSVLRNPLNETFQRHKKMLFLGFAISIFEVASFFMIAFYLVEHFTTIFHMPSNKSLLINILFLSPLVIIQPLIGKLGDKYKNRPLFTLSALGVLIASIPFYFAIYYSWHAVSLGLLALLILLLSIQFALLPSLLTQLFPTTVRFTCIGFSFNLCNSIIGGLIPIMGTWIVEKTGNLATFILVYPIAAMIFLITIPFIKYKEPAHLVKS